MSERVAGSRVWRYLLFLLSMTLAAWQLLFHTHVQTDISAFLPEAQDQEQQLLLQQLKHGSAARLWMLTLSNAPPHILAGISGKLKKKALESSLFDHVMNGDKVLDEKIRTQYFEYRYLLSDRVSAESFSEQGLARTFRELVEVLRSPLSTFRAQLSVTDPSGEFLHLLQSIGTSGSSSVPQHGVWFNERGDHALLLLQSRASGSDLDAQLELREQLQLWVDELTANNTVSHPIVLSMGGVPLISLETREHIRHTAQRLTMAATVFMLLFMFAVYRQPRKVLFTALPLLSGILLASACVSWGFGSIHGITLAFGITLLGVAVDYPVHLLSHQGEHENIAQTAANIWPTLSLSVLSTLLGFSAMLWSEFPGLAQLGVFSICGLLTAALVTRYVLPVLAHNLRPTTQQLGFVIGKKSLPHRTKLWLGAFLLLTLIWAIQGKNIWSKDIWSKDIQALSPVPVEVRQADQHMRKVMGAPEPGHIVLLTADSTQQLLQKQEQMQPLLLEAVRRGYVEDVNYAARILPSEKMQLQRRSQIPRQQELEINLAAALKNQPFKQNSFVPFTEGLLGSRQLPPLLPDRLKDSVLGMQFNSLLQHNGNSVTGLMKLIGLHDAEALAALLRTSSREDLRLLDLRAVTSDLIDSFRVEVMNKSVLALIFIAVLAALWLRDPVRWLRVMLPVLLSIAVSVTVVLATGSSLNLFHLVSLLLVAGVGVDYALFFSLPSVDSAERTQTVHALTVCCISTVVVFSLLAASDIPVLQSIGLTVASGSLAAYVLCWLFSSNLVHTSHISCHRTTGL